MNDKLFYVLVTAFTLILFGGILFFATRPTVTNQNPNTTAKVDVDQLLGDARNVYGNLETAKVTIVEFADFQCPACKSAWGEVARIKDEFGDSIAIVYRQFPLTSIHNYAFNASVASEAAARQGKFFEYHDILYRNQSDNANPLKEEDFISYAEELSLDIERFKEDYNSDEVKQLVRSDMNFAEKIGINSTPTFFVNGERVEFPNLYGKVQALLQDSTVTPTTQEATE